MSEELKTHAMFEQLFRGIAEPYVALAPDAPAFSVVAVNDAFEQLARLSRDEMLGRDFFGIFSTCDQGQCSSGLEELRGAIARVARDGGDASVGTLRYDIFAHAGDSEEVPRRWWSPCATAVMGDDGEVAYILVSVEDVTDLAGEIASRKHWWSFSTRRSTRKGSAI